MNLSFLGLGAMGYPMAGHLARKGHDVKVWNRTEAVARRHAEEYGSRAVDLAAAARSDVVFSCFPTSREVDEVIDRVWADLRAGTTWVDCTSGDPAASRMTAERLRAAGIAFLDAPVSGGRSGAEKGTLTVMAGGDPEALDRVRPALESFAAKVVPVGGVGAGHALKAINNTLLAIHILAAAEGLQALALNGIDPVRALDVLNASSGRSLVSEKLLPEPLATGVFPLNFKLGLMAKDVGIGAAIVRAAGMAAPLTTLAAELLERAKAELGAGADYLELARAARDASGTSQTQTTAGQTS